MFKDITRTTDEANIKIEKLASMTTSTDNAIISSTTNMISIKRTFKITSNEFFSTDMLSSMSGSAPRIYELQQFQQ
jgi:hypothetical protein